MALSKRGLTVWLAIVGLILGVVLAHFGVLDKIGPNTQMPKQTSVVLVSSDTGPTAQRPVPYCERTKCPSWSKGTSNAWKAKRLGPTGKMKLSPRSIRIVKAAVANMPASQRTATRKLGWYQRMVKGTQAITCLQAIGINQVQHRYYMRCLSYKEQATHIKAVRSMTLGCAKTALFGGVAGSAVKGERKGRNMLVMAFATTVGCAADKGSSYYSHTLPSVFKKRIKPGSVSVKRGSGGGSW